MIYISDDAVRRYVEYLKGLVEKGEIEPGKSIINVKVGEAIGPHGMPQSTIRGARAAAMLAGYISKHGNILQGKAIINTSFGRDPVDEIVATVRMAVDEANNKEPKRRLVDAIKDPNYKEPETEDEGVLVNLYELIDSLDYNEKSNLIVMLVESLSYPVEDLSNRLVAANRDLARHVDNINSLREELKEARVELQTSRESLGRARSSVAPRVVERYVKIDTKKAPPGMGHGATFGKDQKAVVVHRKPLMGHTPKVVRKKRGTE